MQASAGGTARVPIGCPAATAAAYRERPFVSSDPMIRHVPPKWAWLGPINIARQAGISGFSSPKRTRVRCMHDKVLVPSSRENRGYVSNRVCSLTRGLSYCVISCARGTQCKTPCVLRSNTKVPRAGARGSYSA